MLILSTLFTLSPKECKEDGVVDAYGIAAPFDLPCQAGRDKQMSARQSWIITVRLDCVWKVPLGSVPGLAPFVGASIHILF